MRITGEEYFTNRRSISQPGRKKARHWMGRSLLRTAQKLHTANSVMRASRVATAAP